MAYRGWGLEDTPLYTVYKLPYREQVMTTFLNEIPLKIRRGTVLHFSIYTNFACSKRSGKLRGFLSFGFSRRSENVLRFHEFPRTSRITKTEKLA